MTSIAQVSSGAQTVDAFTDELWLKPDVDAHSLLTIESAGPLTQPDGAPPLQALPSINSCLPTLAKVSFRLPIEQQLSKAPSPLHDKPREDNTSSVVELANSGTFLGIRQLDEAGLFHGSFPARISAWKSGSVEQPQCDPHLECQSFCCTTAFQIARQ